MLKVSVFHEQEYGALPLSAVAVNGCIHLLGGHTGFASGKALSYITSYPLYIAVSERSDSSLRFFYADTGERKRAALQSLKYKREDRWANAIKAVIAAFVNKRLPVVGLNITVLCDIPSSSMGITEAMVLAAALLLRALYAPTMSDGLFIQLVSSARTSFLGLEPALADTLCALYGIKNSFLLSDFVSGSYRLIESPLPQYSLVVTEAKIPGASVVDELQMRMADCADIFEALQKSLSLTDIDNSVMADIDDFLDSYPESSRRRVLCIVQEICRVDEAGIMLEKKDTAGFLRAINHSHEGLRDLYEISFPEIDWLVKRMQETGSPAAARVIGNGTGGCLYGIIETARLDEYRAKLDEYERIFGFHPVLYTVESAGKAKIYNGDVLNEDTVDK